MIDKMYIMFSSYNYNSENKTLEYISYDENNKTKEGLQNRLIELYKTVLLNENVIGDVMTPIDFDHIEKDLKDLNKAKSVTNLSTFDPLSDIDTRYDFLAGKAGVGQQANSLMDYVLGSLSDLKITNLSVPKSNVNLDQEYSQPLSTEDIVYYKEELKLSDERIKELTSVKISHSLSAILNAFVDIAKDPYITKGNWVTMTTNTGNLLLRKGVHPFYVNALLGQTIITEYIEFSEQYEQSSNQNVSTLEAFIKDKFNLTLEEWNEIEKENVLNYSLKALRGSIGKKGLNKDRINTLNTFLKYQSASKALKKNIDASKFMVDGIGGSITSLNIFKNLVNEINQEEIDYNNLDYDEAFKFKKNIILNFNSKFTNPNGSESMFSKLFRNIITFPDKIVKANPKLFLTSNQIIQDTFNEISYGIEGNLLSNKDLGKQLEEDFYSYVLSGFKPLQMSIEEKTYLLTKFPNVFEEFKKENKGVYAIIDEMIVKPGEKKINYIALNNGIKSTEVELGYVNSFKDLLNDESEFAENLIKYSYLTSGFSTNMNQFFTHIPTEWLIKNGINRYIIDTNSKYTDQNDNNYIDQFFLANIENKKYVKGINTSKYTSFIGNKDLKFNGFIVKKEGKNDYFKVRYGENGNPNLYYKLLGYNTNLQAVYTRFIPNIDGKYVDIQKLNRRDKKGNQIYNFDIKGINLKPTTEAIGKLANPEIQKLLSDTAVYSRDYFYKRNIPLEDFKQEKYVTTESMTVKSITKPVETIETKTVDNQPQSINIYAGNNENSDLSNFAIRPFTINVETPSGEKQYTFQSVEQGFHFYKAMIAENAKVAGEILKTTSGAKLRGLTNKSNLKLTPEQVKEWDNTSKSIMLNLMYDSYSQNPKEAQKLLNTGNTTITHTQDNTRWKTDFPDVVMTVRDMLREEGFDNQLQQQDLFSSAATNFEQIKEQWLNSGRTEEDWNNMEKEEREYVIKNCLQ